MANPQAENGHTDIANELIEALARTRISGEEMQCLWVIFRKTYGWNKKEDWISLSQFEEMTGINQGNIGRSLRKLIAKNIIVKKDNGKGVSYGIQKNYRKWKPLSKKTTTVKKDNQRCQKRQPALSKKTTTKETLTKETTTKEIIPLDQYEISFEEFWDIYPTRNGKKINKANAKKKFFKLKSYDLANVIIAVHNYSESDVVKGGYAKDPDRFISNKDNPEYWKEWMTPEVIAEPEDNGGGNSNQFIGGAGGRK